MTKGEIIRLVKLAAEIHGSVQDSHGEQRCNCFSWDLYKRLHEEGIIHITNSEALDFDVPKMA